METDVYKIDAEQAIKAMRELAGAIQEQTRVSKEAGEHTTESFFKAELAIRAAEKAYGFLKEQIKDFFKEAIEGAIKAEQVERRLEYATGANAEAFKRQATAMAETIGVSREAVEQMQMFLSKHGEAPGKINDTILAVENWAAATGGDANDALNQLVMSSERGTGSVKALGLHIKSTGEVTKDLALFTEKLNKQWDGAALANAESYAGKIAKIGVESDLLKESVGKFLLEAADKTGIIKNLADEIKYYRKQLFGEDALEKALSDRGKLINLQIELQQQFNDAQAHGNQAFIDAHQAEMKDLERRIADASAAVGKLEGGPVGAPATHATAKEEKSEESDADAKKLQAAFKKIFDENQKLIDDTDSLYNSDYDKASAAIEKRTKLRLQGEVEAVAGVHRIRQDFEEKGVAWQISNAARMRALRKQQDAEELADKQYALQQLEAALKGYGARAAGFALDLLKEQVLANTQFNNKMQELAIARGQITDYEGRVLSDHAAAQKQLQKEAEAATQKRLAEFLASLAQEAAMKAIMEGAEAIAEYPEGTAKHLAAAAAFAAVAIAAGGAAAAVSGTRGMTSDEKNQLQSAQKDKADATAERAQREAKNNAQSGGGVQTQVNVYQFGISGLTQTEQMAQLAEIQKKYGQLSTGSEVH